MADVNHVILIGRLTRDAELRYTSGGMAIGKFSLAVNRRVKSGDGWADEASFFDCSVFGKTAESLGSHLVKGKQVAIDGELRQSRWEKDGQTHSRVEIAVNNVQLLGGGAGGARPAPSAQDAQGFPEDRPEAQPSDFPDDILF